MKDHALSCTCSKRKRDAIMQACTATIQLLIGAAVGPPKQRVWRDDTASSIVRLSDVSLSADMRREKNKKKYNYNIQKFTT